MRFTRIRLSAARRTAFVSATAFEHAGSFSWSPSSMGSNGVQKTSKTVENLKNRLFHNNLFFDNFKWYLGGLGVSGGMAWTIRCDSLELWQGLVLHGMGEVDFHVFWKYWKLTSSPNTSKLVLGPPDWSSDFFESQGTISGAIKPINFQKNDPNEK